MKQDKATQDPFIDLDVKKLEQIEAERKKKLMETMQMMPEMHFMRCPRCSSQLKESFITDMNVFICEQCAGIWIDAAHRARALALDCDKAGGPSQAKIE